MLFVIPEFSNCYFFNVVIFNLPAYKLVSRFYLPMTIICQKDCGLYLVIENKKHKTIQ